MRLSLQVAAAATLLLPVFASAQEGAAPTRYGAELGFAFEERVAGHTPSSGTQLAIFHGQVITRIGHTRTSQQERLELVNEVCVIESLWPARRFIVGVSEIFRYTFPSQRRTRIFTYGGAGLASSALHSPDVRQISGWLQYQFQAGVGVKRKMGGTTGLVELGMTHLSNHDTMFPNLGLNMPTLIVGVNF